MRIKLPNFTGSSVLVVGDLMLDRYWSGHTGRISPEAPVPIIRVESVEERPGGAGNVARSVAALGGDCTLIGLLGDDDYGERLEKLLSSCNVDLRGIHDDTSRTVTKLRVMSRHQQLIRLDFENKFSDVSIKKVCESVSNIVSDYDAIILSDYDKGALKEVENIIKISNSSNVPIFIDPKGSDFLKYKGATAITPNQSEFFTVVGECHSEKEIVVKGTNILNQLGLEALVITRSEKGVTLLTKESGSVNVPARAKEVFDVTGAGDTFISVLAACFAAGSTINDAVAIANAGSGIVVGKLGAAVVNTKEIEDELTQKPNLSKKIVTLKQLLNTVSKLRDGNKKIVMTNGCFDILHPGHIEYLARARELGDYLIVAVNSDNSVSRLKGVSRPINSLNDRLTVLSGLQSIDCLISFEEDTPSKIIDDVLPDTLVKGGDYKENEIAGSKSVIENGGEVKIIKYLDAYSTSILVSKIKNETS